MTKLYEKNPPLWEDMLIACREATVSIDLEQFIFVNDEIGRQFIDICAERAAKGVRVRFLWDDAGSWNFLGSFLIAELSRKGVQAAFFNTWIP
ncbi:cardiolipin synthase B, partial [bacterium]|nr:cardiolipin synthase B [bacterium]